LRLRCKLSLRDLDEMFLERGFEFTLETVASNCTSYTMYWGSGRDGH
jgi:transposase-like protein